MATATKSRSRQSKPKANPKAKAESANPVVARRLAFLPDAKRTAAATRFAEGESVAKLADEFGIGFTHATYCLRQQLVEAGSVPRLKPEADAIKAAIADDDDGRSDWHWLACRTGLSTAKVKNLVG